MPQPRPELLDLGFHALGFVFTAVAGYFYVQGGEHEELLEAMKETSAVSPAEVRTMAYQAVRGRAGTEHVLLAPRAREQVVFYRYVQTEEWEQKANRDTIWHKVVRELKVDEEAVVFWVEDGKGNKVEVQPQGARFEGKRLAREQVGASGSVTGAGGRGMGLGYEYRNHRYVHEVHGLVVGEFAFVMGPTRAGADGGPCFAQDPACEKPFLVSGRTPKELAAHNREGMGISTIFTWTWGVAAALCFLAGLLGVGEALVRWGQ